MASPSFHRIAAPLLAGAVLGLFGWMAGGATVSAKEPGPLSDSDGDFLPDVVEWLLMTDPQNADTEVRQDSDQTNTPGRFIDQACFLSQSSPQSN